MLCRASSLVSFSHNHMGMKTKKKKKTRKPKEGKQLAACRKAWDISEFNRSNYHLLSGAFCESVTIAQVVDLDIPDIVSVSDVDVWI